MGIKDDHQPPVRPASCSCNAALKAGSWTGIQAEHAHPPVQGACQIARHK